MQPLPGCNPDGGDATRLTYAVELKPKGILPVKLIEGRIASDLKTNLRAIKEYVEKQLADEGGAVVVSETVVVTETSSFPISRASAVSSTPAMSAVISGIKLGKESATMDLEFENKLLKKRIEFLESEVLKREDKLNSIRKIID